MGKTFKDNRQKYKGNRDFQKKQGKKQKGNKSYSQFQSNSSGLCSYIRIENVRYLESKMFVIWNRIDV